MLEGISLRDCFSVIVAAEDVTVGKPDPSGYLMAMKQLSEKIHHPLAPADCLIVEDAPKVVTSVRQAGFPVLALTSTHSAEKLSDANWVVQSLRLEEVRRAIHALKFVV